MRTIELERGRKGESAGRNAELCKSGRQPARIDFLCPEGNQTTVDIIDNLLTLEVVQFAFASDRDIHEQYVELVQVSANVPSAFGGARTAAVKLAGAQLDNFCGFYKKVWRANDWMFGRLDGAERLARILLNAPRLMKLCGADGTSSLNDVVDELHRICVGTSVPQFERFLETHWQTSTPEIFAELRFLDEPNAFVPEVLPQMGRDQGCP